MLHLKHQHVVQPSPVLPQNGKSHTISSSLIMNLHHHLSFGYNGEGLIS